MKTIFFLFAAFCLVSCDKDETTDPNVEFLTGHEFFIYKYSGADGTIKHDVVPEILVHFDVDTGYIIDPVNKFDWYCEGNLLYITGAFYEFLPDFEAAYPMDMFFTFDFNPVGNTTSMSNVRAGLNYSYFLRIE